MCVHAMYGAFTCHHALVRSAACYVWGGAHATAHLWGQLHAMYGTHSTAHLEGQLYAMHGGYTCHCTLGRSVTCYVWGVHVTAHLGGQLCIQQWAELQYACITEKRCSIYAPLNRNAVFMHHWVQLQYVSITPHLLTVIQGGQLFQAPAALNPPPKIVDYDLELWARINSFSLKLLLWSILLQQKKKLGAQQLKAA